VLTILKIVLVVGFVAALLAGGVWVAGEFITSFVERLLE
jgi:hypothetical protein